MFFRDRHHSFRGAASDIGHEADQSAAMPAMTADHFLVRFISNLAMPRII